MTTSSSRPPRRAESLNHCSIVLSDPKEFAGRLGWHTGVWERGAWRQSNIWTIEASIHFRMPGWSTAATQAGGWRLWGGDYRESPYVEWIEHAVYAKDRAMAIACLVRDLKVDPRAEFISHATVYRVLAPLTKQQVHELDVINARLARERMEREEQQARDGRRARVEKQLEFAIG